MEGTLELPALGRRMCLGTLYDCRSHQIISPDANLWNHETTSKQKKVSEKKSHKVTLVKSHTFNDKCKALEVDESLKASILANLVQPAGSAKFLSDQPPPEGTCRLSVHSKATSAIEQLPLNQLGSFIIQNSAVITEGKATHVVVGILYGSNTFFDFDKTCGEKTGDDCLKSLNALATKFSSSLEERKKSSTFEPKEESGVECKVHSDLDVEGGHFDCKAASKLLVGIPDMIKENALPLKFFLYPLHKIDSRAAMVCKAVSDGLLTQVQEFLEGLEHCSARTSKMAADPLCIDFPQFAEKFTLFKQMLSEYRMDFQKEFARVLPSIHGGSNGESVLKEILQNAASVSSFKLAELDAWLKSKRDEMNTVRVYIQRLIQPEGIEIVKSPESLRDIRQDPCIDNIVCLTFRLAGKEEGYLRSLSHYVATRKESIYSFHQWCDDSAIGDFRSKAKQFVNFFRCNRQSTCTRFIVTGFSVGSSAGEEAKVGGTILLFDQGKLAQEDFEPPSQPGKPQCDVIHHNAIDISWPPPQYGQDGVQRYIVKFKRFRGKNQSNAIPGEVCTEKGETYVTVTNLEPNVALEFQITAVCSAGVSPESESSDRVTTLPASPPGKPHARPASASSIALEWEHPSESGKQVTIRSYAIKFGKVVTGAVPNWQPEVETGSSEGRFTVRNLETNASYVFQVVAIYDSGVTSHPSAKSDVCATFPVSQPGKPELGNVTASSVDMKWKGPTKRGPGVKLKEYFIEYTKVEEQQSQLAEMKWNEVLTKSMDDSYKLSDLMPNTTYISHVVLVCEDDVMISSEPSRPFTTLPAGPPTEVTVGQISATDIEVTWSKPTLISQQKAIKHYRVEYQIVGVTTSVEVKEIKTKDDSCVATINDATPETKFRIRVTAVCGKDETLGEGSNVVSFTTRRLLKHEIRARVDTKPLQQGNQKDGTPCILKFPVEEVCLKKHSQSFRFGSPPKMPVEHKVIMVVGVTGSGKSTLINGMINYFLDIDRCDDFRFKIVDANEAKGSSQANSQTQVLTSYTIYRNKYLSLPYTVTVIDSPGFGDTRGIARDKAIVEQIREFFSDAESHDIDHIDAIGFVVKASDSRLTPTQRYVFDSILSVFGKDVSENILLLVTFADSNPPPVLAAVEEAQMPFTGNMYKFNNSALFAGVGNKEGRKKKTRMGNPVFDDMFWQMGKQSFKDFFYDIQSLTAQSLVLTQAVLEERRRLEVAVQGLQPQIQMGFCKLEELRRERQALEQHEAEIEASKDFKILIDVPKYKKIDITGNYITNCNKCHFTCHFPCYIADDADKADCAAMNEGVCAVCPGKCPWDVHFNQQYKFEYYTEKETRTFEEIEARYKDASGKKMTVEQLMKELQEDFNTVRGKVFTLIGVSHKSVMRLDEIALKPNPLSAVDYVDILIESEKNSCKPGWQDRMCALQDVRKNADIISKIKEEKFDPFESALGKEIIAEPTQGRKTAWEWPSWFRSKKP